MTMMLALVHLGFQVWDAAAGALLGSLRSEVMPASPWLHESGFCATAVDE